MQVLVFLNFICFLQFRFLGHRQDRQGGVRLHGRGPDCLVPANGRSGWSTGKWKWWNQCNVSRGI